MRVNDITTIVDLAFNLSGSLAGIPVILSQLPVGDRIGLDTLPEVWEDVEDIGQTWAPNLTGQDIEVQIESYNAPAVNKAPYTTDIGCIDVASDYGNKLLEALESDEWYSLENIPIGDIAIPNNGLEILIVSPPSEFNVARAFSPTGSGANFNLFAFNGGEKYTWLRRNASGTVTWSFGYGPNLLVFSAASAENVIKGAAPVMRLNNINWYNDGKEILTVTYPLAISRITRSTYHELIDAPAPTDWSLGKNVFVRFIK